MGLWVHSFFPVFLGTYVRMAGEIVNATNSYRWVSRALTCVLENPTVDILETCRRQFLLL
jgi:hypothetical protein